MHGVCELYQLLEAGWWLSVVGCVYSVSYLRQDDKLHTHLHTTSNLPHVTYRLHTHLHTTTNLPQVTVRLHTLLHTTASAPYLIDRVQTPCRQQQSCLKVGGFMHGVCELYQLLEAGWWLSVVGCVYSVSYLRQDCCCLHGVCTLSIKY
jgi:hypothetical protein